MTAKAQPLEALVWQDPVLRVLDQRLLPGEERWLELREPDAVAAAIRDMAVRGAPAIGIAAAYGAALAARERARGGGDWRPAWARDLERLAAARPTAVNLAWALARLRRRAAAGADPEALLAEARAIHAEDREQNLRLAGHGAALIAADSSVMTHCNTGALATGGHGTALGVIRSAHAAGKIRRVYATETRPWLQGARLTAWELARESIPVTLIADAAAAAVMRGAGPAWVIVGADRIAANGDVANKIGTYALALLAREHGLRFMVAAPTSSLDMTLPDGTAIPIEDRGGGELWRPDWGPPPAGLGFHNPVFDLTPAALIDAIVTERGVVERPDAARMAAAFGTGKKPERGGRDMVG